MIRHSGILCTIVPDHVLHFQLKVEAHRVTLTCVSMSMSESPDLRFVNFPKGAWATPSGSAPFSLHK